VGKQAKHVPKALRFFGWEILGNNFIVQGTTLLFVYTWRAEVFGIEIEG
jgi:hypothetical protein